MHVLAAEVSFRIPHAQTLKEKRSVLNSILDRLPRLGVAVAEVSAQESSNNAVIGIAAVSGSSRVAEETIDEALRLVWSRPEIEVVSDTRTWTEFDR